MRWYEVVCAIFLLVFSLIFAFSLRSPREVTTTDMHRNTTSEDRITRPRVQAMAALGVLVAGALGCLLLASDATPPTPPTALNATSTSAGATTPPQSTTGPSLVEAFNQPDGDLVNNWSSTGSNPVIKVVSGKGSTLNSTSMSIAYKSHGVDVSGDWQIEFDVSAPLSIGHGGATVGLVNPADGSGYSVFIGNATHIQRYNPGGTHDNLTNNGRPGEGGGQSANRVVFTHTAAGDMQVYLDGVLWSWVNDTQRVAGKLLFIALQNADSPSFEATIDNIVVKDHIGN